MEGTRSGSKLPSSAHSTHPTNDIPSRTGLGTVGSSVTVGRRTSSSTV